MLLRLHSAEDELQPLFSLRPLPSLARPRGPVFRSRLPFSLCLLPLALSHPVCAALLCIRGSMHPPVLLFSCLVTPAFPFPAAAPRLMAFFRPIAFLSCPLLLPDCLATCCTLFFFFFLARLLSVFARLSSAFGIVRLHLSLFLTVASHHHFSLTLRTLAV